jgi:hypothetical protein
MKNRTSIWSSAPIVVFMALGGCATYNMTNPAPHEAKPIAVNFVDDDLSGWTDLPIGTYGVPDSQVGSGVSRCSQRRQAVYATGEHQDAFQRHGIDASRAIEG